MFFHDLRYGILFVMTATMLPCMPQAMAASHYDAVKDFSIGANPNGVWTYMDSTTLAYSQQQYQSVNGLPNWSNNKASPQNVAIVKNTTSQPVTLYNGALTIPTDHLLMESNDNLDGANIIFTALKDGIYIVKGDFLGLDVKDVNYTHVYIIEDGDKDIYSNYARANRPRKFKLSVTLAAGDTLTFQCGPNARSKYRHDVGLAATIVGP